MKLLATILTVVPSVALAHPGHHGGAAHDSATNPWLIVAMISAVAVVLYREWKVRQ